MESNKDINYLLEQITSGIHDVIHNGYHENGLNIPVLDPLIGIPNIIKHLDIDHAQVDISINQIVLKGLASLKIEQNPQLDLATRSLSFRLSFDKLSLKSEDVKVEGTYRILFKHQVDKQVYIHIDASGVELLMKFALRLDDEGPTIKADGSEIVINNLDVDIEDSLILDLLIPLFKAHIEQLLSQQLEAVLEQFLTSRLRAIYLAQKPIFKKLVKLYQMKKAQGLVKNDNGNPEKPRILEGFGGVGQLPLPLFWELPSVDVAHLEHINMEELKSRARTGDVVLFSGSLASSQRIRRYTQSAFSHVTFVVKAPEFANGAALIWQSTSSTHRGVLRNMEHRAGIQLNYLEEMIHDYMRECPGSTVVYRSLNEPPQDEEIKLEKWQALIDLIHREDGKPYTDDMSGLYIMGLMEIDNPKKDDFFCAGLVAQSMMNYGILKDIFMQYQYAPRDFCHRQEALPFAISNTSFGPEIVVDV